MPPHRCGYGWVVLEPSPPPVHRRTRILHPDERQACLRPRVLRLAETRRSCSKSTSISNRTVKLAARTVDRVASINRTSQDGEDYRPGVHLSGSRRSTAAAHADPWRLAPPPAGRSALRHRRHPRRELEPLHQGTGVTDTQLPLPGPHRTTDCERLGMDTGTETQPEGRYTPNDAPTSRSSPSTSSNVRASIGSSAARARSAT
jgi:hypothetical protein